MELTTTHIDGPLIIQPNVIGDHRGYFAESYNAKEMKKFGLDENFVQDNQSLSKKGILRGLHFQNPPFAQGKLVRVIKGKVLDVIVDIRKKSPTYGEHICVELSEENFTMLWVPPGFAHGFVTLEDDTIFAYKCTNFYAPESEGGLAWNDPSLGINWGIENPLLSEKDKVYPSFEEFDSAF
jgi:dTDP-4-dehydrorhamnose 3,5-epimerase